MGINFNRPRFAYHCDDDVVGLPLPNGVDVIRDDLKV